MHENWRKKKHYILDNMEKVGGWVRVLTALELTLDFIVHMSDTHFPMYLPGT